MNNYGNGNNMNAAIAASMRNLNIGYENDMGAAILASSEHADSDFLEDMLMQLTGMQGNPAARKKLIAIAGLDTAMKYGVPAKNARPLLEALEGELYSETPAELTAAYRNAQPLIEGVRAEPIMQRLQDVHDDMTRQEAANNARKLNATRAAAAEATAQRARNAAAANAARLNAAKSARNAFLKRFEKKGRKATRKSRKMRKATRKMRR